MQNQDSLSSLLEKKRKHSSNKLAMILTGMIACASVAQTAFYVNNGIADRKQQKIENIIDRKIDWYIKISNATVSMRSVNEKISSFCKMKDNYSAEEYTKTILNLYAKREDAKVALVQSYSGTQFIFNNNVFNKIKDFVSLNEKYSDLCISSAPNSDFWREKENKIDALMTQSIDESQEQLK